LAKNIYGSPTTFTWRSAPGTNTPSIPHRCKVLKHSAPPSIAGHRPIQYLTPSIHSQRPNTLYTSPLRDMVLFIRGVSKGQVTATCVLHNSSHPSL